MSTGVKHGAAGQGLGSVPRSKGCINCTSRKTRCDGRRPTCQACERRMQVCRGYRRGDFVFMNEGWKAPGVASSSTAFPVPSQSQSQNPTSASASNSSTNDNNEEMAIIPYSPLIPIRQDPLPIYTTFFLSQFTRDPPPEAYVMIENCHRYLGRLLLLRSPAPAPTRASSCGSRGGELEHDPLALAAEALVMNHFGKLHRSSRLVRESISPYVCALKALSAKLSRIQRVGIELVEEEEVMELVFACLFLAFWELGMNPQGTAWQKHVRGLANILQSRGPQGFQSRRSFRVIVLVRLFILLESISSKQPTFLSERRWQRFRNFRPRYLPWCPSPSLPLPFRTLDGSTAAEGNGAVALEANEVAARVMAEMVGPKHFLDFILDHLIKVANLTAEFAQRRDSDVPTGGSRSSSPTMSRIQAESLAVLERLETTLEYMMANIGGPLSAQNSTSPRSTTPAGPFWGKPMEYNLASMCRTAAITLRLLIYDLVNGGGHPTGCSADESRIDSRDNKSAAADHRAVLMAHVEAIVNTIPYSTHGSILEVAPLCFVPAFRIAKVVLVREAEVLKAEGRDMEAARCAALEALIQSHLDFVASRKISIKIDM